MSEDTKKNMDEEIYKEEKMPGREVKEVPSINKPIEKLNRIKKEDSTKIKKKQ